MASESEVEPKSIDSMVHIRASDAFPKKEILMLFSEDSSTVGIIPFTLLSGEYAEFAGKTTDGSIVLTNYRLVVQIQSNSYSIPIGLLETVELKDIFFLYFYSKDAKTYRCTFSSNDQCVEWHKKLSAAISSPRRIENLFAFAHYAWGNEEGTIDYQNNLNNAEPSKSMFEDEVERMGFDLTISWRISTINDQYSLCLSYPTELLVPATIDDKVLIKLSTFRSSKRIPAVVWRHRGNGCVIARCSQPEMGWMGWRSNEDEKLIQEIGLACTYNGGTNRRREDEICEDQQNLQIVNSPKVLKILILDARSYAAAFTNRAKGGGYECPEYYPNCEIQFMNLVNIHYIRKSFHNLRAACAAITEQPNWLSLLENTKWLHYISGLLRASMMAVNAIEEERAVVVHCSDGWDRTSQIVSLAELMLDPYYRTIRGFQVLVEKEWLEFGHKFGDRCGHGLLSDDANERCPVFLQWLDCVHQLLIQFPISFEFNESFLVKLVEHTYSCLFGTFLCNNSRERNEHKIQNKTYSVWSFLNLKEHRYRNFLYVKNDSVLKPSFQVRDLRFWNSLFLQSSDSIKVSGVTVVSNGSASIETEENSGGSTPKEELLLPVPNGVEAELEEEAAATDEEEQQQQPSNGLVKTRSCGDLSSSLILKQRRLSDPRNLCELLSCEKCDSGSVKSKNLRESSDLEEGEMSLVNGEMSGKKDCSSEVSVELEPEIKTKVFETSTDTLVGELEPKKEEEEEEEDDVKLLLLSNNGNLNVNISTSTTELSDSRVQHYSKAVQSSNNYNNNNNNNLINNNNFELLNGSGKCALCSNGSCWCRSRKIYYDNFRTSSSGSAAGSGAAAGSSSVNGGTNFNGCRSPSFGFNSRTPSSGFPATPCDERSAFSSGSSSGSSNTLMASAVINGGSSSSSSAEKKLMFDIDGLSVVNDEVQLRLNELIAEHEAKVVHLKHLLSLTQLALCQQVCQRCNSQWRNNMTAEIMDEVVN
ncbi:Myotubularin- protein 3 [Chamberlinius hualienensis]